MESAPYAIRGVAPRRCLALEPGRRVVRRLALVEVGPLLAGRAGRDRHAACWLPAASVAPDQCASASSALSAAMYASIEAAMMFGPRASPRVLAAARARRRRRGGAIRTVTAPIGSVPSPSAWMS